MSERTAKRSPVHNGPAAWSVILGAQNPAEKLEGSHTADFVIIGGGFAGLSAARRLRQLDAKASIILLEAGHIAEGASGRNSGFMIDLPHDLASQDYAGSDGGGDKSIITLNRQAINFAGEAVGDYGINPNYFDRCGKVNGAASEEADAHNVSYSCHLAELGEISERLDQQQMYELTGSRHYRAGLYTPGTVMLQPAGYVRGLAGGLRRQGVRVFENSPAVGFSVRSNCVQVKTPKGDVTGAKLILANNGHLESFGFAQKRLMHIFLFASMTEELEGAVPGQPRWGITPSDPMGTTVRKINNTQGGNRIVTRTCAVMRPNMQASDADVSRAAAVHRRKFDQRFPHLTGAKMEHTWAGHLCLTLNGVSVMREVERNVFSACAQNGLGTARGTLTGMGAAELAFGSTSAITDHFTNEAEPKRLPPQPFASMGANAYMRLKEWQAGDE